MTRQYSQFKIMEQPKILVAIRKRPLSKKQLSKGQTDIISVKSHDTVIVSEYKQKVDLTKYLEETIFNFDYAFNQETRNEDIYEQAVRPLVDSAFQGAKVTCFAYGQTGSGKTYTMNGNINQGIPGLYYLGANDIFQYLASPHFRHLKARLSFYQIYCGKLYDLLNKRNQLKLRQDNKNNINIIGLEEAVVSSSQQFFEYLLQGSKERVTSMNSANADSSRSHAILQISLKDGKKLFGKISFIDLAGNQRGADHMDMGKQTRIDGAQINKSLLSLKECIRALDQGKGHTPFRGSKLTMVLKDSFVGFCRTVMIGNVSPSSASSQNTLNTLRYADRVKQLRKPQEGGGSKEDIKAKEMMLPRQNKNAIRIMINNDDDAEDIARKRDEAQKEYGIAEEPPKRTVKEENSGRKNSFNGKMQPKVEQKSSSVAKNYVGHKPTLSNNLMGPPPSLINNKGQTIPTNPSNKRGIGMQPQYQNNRQMNIGLQRYNSTQYGTRKQQQMEIQATSPYYVPHSKNNQTPRLFNQHPQSNMQNQPNQRMQPQQPINMNHSQAITNNYSNISMNSNLSMSHNPYNPAPIRNNNFQQQPPNCYQQGYGSQNYNQPPYHQQPQKNNFMPSNQMNANNYQQPQFNPNEYQLPQNWEDMAVTVANSNDPDFTEHVLSQMNQRLFSEEEELVRNHSDSLRREIDIIKSEMSQLNQMQIERGKITSRDYVQFLQDGIEQKISLLQQLRQKLINFTYKLDTMQQIERKNLKGGSHIDDEQLLDDINY